MVPVVVYIGASGYELKWLAVDTPFVQPHLLWVNSLWHLSKVGCRQQFLQLLRGESLGLGNQSPHFPGT